MAKKYGVNEYGDISKNNCGYHFTKNMKDMCGKWIELERVNSLHDSVIGKYNGYYIEEWMVKKNGK